MSRFFHGDSSSESSSSDEEELYSEEEEEEQQDESEEESEDESSEEEGKPAAKGGLRFLRDTGEDSSEESSDEEGRKVVKSAKDKRLEELEGTVKLIENAEKINDWAVISSGEPFLPRLFGIQGLCVNMLSCHTRVRQAQ
jgi:translation initiation factor 3 subunit C